MSIREHIEESARVKQSLLEQVPKIEAAVETLYQTSKGGGTIYACGNGGSACDAMHFVEECVARFWRERPGIRAQHLCDPGTLTCWANDYNYESVFERQVETLVTKKDILVAFTTSGNSESILRALVAAQKQGATTIALLGKGGGKAKSLTKQAIIVDSDKTHHVQEAHIALVHIFIDQLEIRLFPECVV